MRKNQLSSPMQYVPISNASLTASVPVGVDIYFQASTSDTPVLVCPATQAPTESQIGEFASQTGGQLCVPETSRQRFNEYIRDHWKTLVHDSDRGVSQRVNVLSDIVRGVLGDRFSQGDPDNIVDAATALSRSIIDVLFDSDCQAADFSGILHHDHAPATHCTNVALYCAVLAREIGFQREACHQIVVGGLLHDIGKNELDENLLNKPGGLTNTQYREVQRHPILGFSSLSHRADLEFGQLMMVYQHHERLDGSGYPAEVCGDEIHAWAKLCAIVDAYAALTAKRPYRESVTPTEAIEILTQDSGTAFEPDFLDCWSRSV